MSTENIKKKQSLMVLKSSAAFSILMNINRITACGEIERKLPDICGDPLANSPTVC
jgi:hypothetical protein